MSRKPAGRKPAQKKLSKMQQAVAPHANLILTGTIISIDPSSGSRESMPGYAIYRAGQLVDSGHIQLSYGQYLHKRLFALGRTLRESFERPDILVTENIPPVMQGNGFFNRSMVSLQRAIGVVQSSFDAPCIEVAPITWRTNIPEDYNKTDECDSIMMGHTVLKAAAEVLGLEPPVFGERLLRKLRTGDWG